MRLAVSICVWRVTIPLSHTVSGLPRVGQETGGVLIYFNISVYRDERSSIFPRVDLALLTNVDVPQVEAGLGVVPLYHLVPYGVGLVVLDRRGKLDGKKRPGIFIVS